MKRFVILAAVAALLAPAAATANSSQPPNASRDCVALKAKIGATAFAQAYTSFGACVSAMSPFERMNATSAEAACTAERNDSSFATTHNGVMFAPFYGNGKNGKNAFGRCVSLKEQASSQTVQQNQPNPARTCAALRTQLGLSAFNKQFGVNGNARNAFGKCVSKTARANASAQTSAAKLCLTEQSLAGFAAHYGTNANRSNAFGVCVSQTAHSIQAKA
jgi:opacity protein-like surface antigen